jgi:hypothetical protein
MQRFPFTIAQRILPSCWRRQRISTRFEQLRFSFVIFNSERWLWCSDGVLNCTAIGWNPDGKQAYTLSTDSQYSWEDKQSVHLFVHRHF